MNKKKKGCMPRLRFPEFMDMGEWKVKTLSKLAKVTTGNKDTKDKIENGLYPFFVRSQTVERIDSYSYNGEAILTSGDGVGVGKNFHYIIGKFDFHQRVYCIFEFEKGVLGKFLYLYFSVHFLERIIRLSAKNSVDSVRKSMITEMPIPLATLPEQQKIANCLSSLDKVINLETEKLEALKSHKKGLMQQLFPREGETTPRLRFPEFRNAEEWEIKLLKNISPSIFDGTHQTPKYVGKGVPFFSVENIISGNKNKYISREAYEAETVKNKPERGDILITRIGSIGFSKVVSWDYDFSIYVTLAVVKKSKLFNSQYLHLYFQTENYQSEILSKSLLSAIPCKINMNELQKTKILLPSLPEQQKIADCLSSLDRIIELQTQKLDTLKSHKKGLMQQLFPQEV